jgi:hypothetical protein
MKISSIRGLKSHLNSYSGFTDDTICNVITALGFDPIHGTQEDFIELSMQLENCAEYGADIGISGFIYYNETIPFFKKTASTL